MGLKTLKGEGDGGLHGAKYPLEPSASSLF